MPDTTHPATTCEPLDLVPVHEAGHGTRYVERRDLDRFSFTHAGRVALQHARYLDAQVDASRPGTAEHREMLRELRAHRSDGAR